MTSPLMGKVKAVIASGGTVGGVNKCHTVGEGVDERPTALGGDRRQQLNLSKNVVTTEIVGTDKTQVGVLLLGGGGVLTEVLLHRDA